jgi:hypothetical protein
MSILNYLLIALSISTIGYLLYRLVFLKNGKKELPNKPYFTLKIEPE